MKTNLFIYLYPSIFIILLINTESIAFSHIPVVSAVEGCDVIISVGDLSSVDIIANGILFFRQKGDNEYNSRQMFETENSYMATIPAKYVKGKAIEYYIALYMSDGTINTFPAQNAVSLPYAIIIIQAKQDWFEVLYPEKNSIIDEKKPEISVSFANSLDESDKIQIILDGIDITKNCEITEYFLSYVPIKDLDNGVHSIAILNLNKPDNVGSWQFVVKGKKKAIMDFNGNLSATWQYADSDSEYKYMIYNEGSNFGFFGQLAGQIYGYQFGTWANRNNFYNSKTNDYGLNFYSDKLTINAGDIFPTVSRLTLDGLPARGAEFSIKPFERLNLQLIFAENRLYYDDKDKFLSDLLNSKFGCVQLSVSPIKDKWQVTTSYIYAKNDANIDLEIPLSLKKKNSMFSLGTNLKLPAEFGLNIEWINSKNKTAYVEDFGSEMDVDQGFFAGINKQLKTLSLETFYIDVGKNFISEVNPFLEIGKKGLGFSAQYSNIKGLSFQSEYIRYYQESDTETQIRTNLSLFPKKFPTLNLGYYKQRITYAKYDIDGVNIGSSFKFWKLYLSSNASWSNSNSWQSKKNRNTFFLSNIIKFEIASKIYIYLDRAQFWFYESDCLSIQQKQISLEIQKHIKKRYITGICLKSVSSTDRLDKDKNEKIVQIKCQYLF